MRFRLLLLALAGMCLLPLTTTAQVTPEPEQMETGANQTADYCTMIFEGTPQPDKFISMDFGRGTKAKYYTPDQAEMVKKMESQTSSVRIINYLSQRGWELTAAYALRDDNKFYHYFTFKRK